ncbi:MAG: hypothetical protein FWH00_03230 [Oscillospiraceae bacterium]|nr:hypothetical protein [Oscillospiraceae bacterium]
MLEKMKNAFLAGCVKGKIFSDDLRNNEEGMEIIQVVLLVLVGVLLIVGIYGAMTGWLQQLWSNITGTAESGLTAPTF